MPVHRSSMIHDKTNTDNNKQSDIERCKAQNCFSEAIIKPSEFWKGNDLYLILKLFGIMRLFNIAGSTVCISRVNNQNAPWKTFSELWVILQVLNKNSENVKLNITANELIQEIISHEVKKYSLGLFLHSILELFSIRAKTCFHFVCMNVYMCTPSYITRTHESWFVLVLKASTLKLLHSP